MIYNLVLHSEATSEITEAFEWYEEIREGLGFELIEEIEICFQNIIASPDRYSCINQFYRRIKTKRFPYVIVYEIENQDIIVISVRHIKRHVR